MKFSIALVFIGIIGSLIAAGVFMVRGGADKQDKAANMAKALSWRIGLSIALFVAIIFSYAMGWIQPSEFGTVR